MIPANSRLKLFLIFTALACIASYSGCSNDSGAQSKLGVTDNLPNPAIVEPETPLRHEVGPELGIHAKSKNITVSDLDSNTKLEDSATSTIEFKVKNSRTNNYKNIDLKLLLSKELRLVDFDPMSSGLNLVSRSEDFSKFSIQRIFEMRPDEELTFRADVSGINAGNGTVEIAASSDSFDGNLTASVGVQVVDSDE